MTLKINHSMMQIKHNQRSYQVLGFQEMNNQVNVMKSQILIPIYAMEVNLPHETC